jgi:HAE1 family hydrophobic/amphiphilic exporter-1
VLGSAAVVFALTLLVVPMLGADLIPQLAQDRFEMTVKLPPARRCATPMHWCANCSASMPRDDGFSCCSGVSWQRHALDANPTESGENIGKADRGDGRWRQQGIEAAETERLRETMPPIQPPRSTSPSRSSSASRRRWKIELRGADLGTIDRAGQQMAAMLRKNRTMPT